MIVNAEALARLYTAFTAVFNAAFQETETWYERVAMTVPVSHGKTGARRLPDWGSSHGSKEPG